MTVEVRVSDYFTFDGVHIHVRQKGSLDTLYVTGIENGHLVWEPLTETQLLEARPSPLMLTNDVARALLDALLRHYQGASDMHTVRADLLHERGRVDGLIETVSRLVVELAGS